MNSNDSTPSTADELKEENFKLRMLVALNYANFNLTSLYLDDGEIQDNSRLPFIDFRRDSVELIAMKMGQRKIQS